MTKDKVNHGLITHPKRRPWGIVMLTTITVLGALQFLTLVRPALGIEFEWIGTRSVSSFLFDTYDSEPTLMLWPNSSARVDDDDQTISGSFALTAFGMDFRRLDVEFDGERSRWTFGLGKARRDREWFAILLWGWLGPAPFSHARRIGRDLPGHH